MEDDDDLNFIRQQTLADTVEISGVTQTANEDLRQVVSEIAKITRVALPMSEIVQVHRMKGGKIWAQLKSEKKASSLVAGSVATKITNLMIGVRNVNPHQASQIFVNHALTIENQLLNKKLRELKKENKIFKIIFRNSSFSVKKFDDSPFVIIQRESELWQFD